MINIKGTLPIRDRWPFDITKLEVGESRQFDPRGTDYVLLHNASLSTSIGNLRNVEAAICHVDPYAVTCGDTDSSAVIISYPGLRLLENRYYVQRKLDQGNLSYMDGGTNTTAVNPGRLGDPVVNYVHFPANMYQTLHTHPSHRVGLVLSGNGKIELDNNEYFDIRQGEAFFMRRNELHNFITDKEPVILFVFAPDSGTGPTDEVNPLKIRTYIGQQRYSK